MAVKRRAGSGLGEFDIVALFSGAAVPRGSWVRTGIGDDCAVLDMGGGRSLLVTSDMLLERVHFLRGTATPWQLGFKAMAVNISDVAAMGGEPRAAFLALGLTAGLELSWLEALRDGLLACAARYGTDLLGGDTVAARSDLSLCLTLLGQAPAQEVVLRSGAQPGDAILVGGDLGASAAGLRLLLDGDPQDLLPADRRALLRAHLEPQPQVGLGRLLAKRGLARAMIDISDGLAQDLGHVCRASGVGAQLERAALPLSPAALRLAALTGEDALTWALHGGEDYRLLCCVPAERAAEVQAVAAGALETELHRIGTITAERGMRIGRAGAWQTLQATGYQHLTHATGEDDG